MGSVVAFPVERMGAREMPVTRKQLARDLGFSVRWIDYRISEGMPSHKLKGARRLYRSEVDAWLRGRGWA